MRAIETGTLEDGGPPVLEESALCVGCRPREPVCPAGVQYGALLEEWRDHAWTGRRKPLRLRALLWAVNRRWRGRLLGLPRRPARGRGGGGPCASLLLRGFERGPFPEGGRAAKRLRAGGPPPP